MGDAKRRQQREPQIPIIEPEDWQPIDKAAVTVQIIWGHAALRGSVPTTEIPGILRIAERLGWRDRQGAMNYIIDHIKTDQQETASKLLTVALGLALSSDAGAALHDMDLAGFTVTYAISPTGPDRNNWRLTVEGPAPVFDA